MDVRRTRAAGEKERGKERAVGCVPGTPALRQGCCARPGRAGAGACGGHLAQHGGRCVIPKDALRCPPPGPAPPRRAWSVPCRAQGEPESGRCPDSLPKPALICPGELTCSSESTESIPNLWGPLVFVSSPPFISGWTCGFSLCSVGYNIPFSLFIFVLKLSGCGRWPFCLALLPLALSPPSFAY